MSIFLSNYTASDVLDAAVTGNVARVKKLLAKGDCSSDAPELVRALNSACANGNTELATLLLDYGVNAKCQSRT